MAGIAMECGGAAKSGGEPVRALVAEHRAIA
jgi:hypothetical protein